MTVDIDELVQVAKNIAFIEAAETVLEAHKSGENSIFEIAKRIRALVKTNA